MPLSLGTSALPSAGISRLSHRGLEPDGLQACWRSSHQVSVEGLMSLVEPTADLHVFTSLPLRLSPSSPR